MSDDPNDKFMADTINAFKATPNADYELYYGKDFQDKFPYLNFGSDGYGCYDPSGGILMADKALRAIQVIIIFTLYFWVKCNFQPSRERYEINVDTLKDLAVKMGATLIDGFDVETIEEHNDMVTVTGTDKSSYTAPSLGRNVIENNFLVNNVI